MLAGQAIQVAVETAENRALTLEHIVDRDGVLATLESLAYIAHAKADHIREEWQDDGLADMWTRIARRIGSLPDSDSFMALCRAAVTDK
jgi:hypothetical protein